MREYSEWNKNWEFRKYESETEKNKTEIVKVPHTWNKYDGQDGGSDYYRGSCWYSYEYQHMPDGRECYLEFQGVNAVADIYVNQKFVAHHEGGFSTFRTNISDFLQSGNNQIEVKADNGVNDYVYPQKADFTFFGGIYRKVFLIKVPKTHFDMDYYGSQGVKIVQEIKNGYAELNCTAYIKGNLKGKRLRFTLMDQDKNTLEEQNLPLEKRTECKLIIKNPHLWQGIYDPYLYTVQAEILEDNVVLDEVKTKIGIRKYFVNAQEGFFLNGYPYPLRGVARHQDREDKGWAISYEDMEEDIHLIMEMGANTIRLAHYQHDSHFYQLCDEYGLVVWAEIPFISNYMDNRRAKENTLQQLRELIIQNYHHPSICFWGLANEITIGGEETDALLNNLQELQALAKRLDPQRLTTMANVSFADENGKMNRIPDLLAYNHYFGWYVGQVETNGKWLDCFHKNHPDIKIGLSEYGCEANIKWHSDTPKVKDYSEEYQAYYHEEMLKILTARPYVWGSYVWNMFDFAADNRDEGGAKGRNNKGLVTFDRKVKKDAYYIYQAYWSKQPMVHLCGKRYKERTSSEVQIKVYSNCNQVALYVNGTKAAEECGNKIFVFSHIPLEQSENLIEAVAGNVSDHMVIYRVETLSKQYSFMGDNNISGENVANWFDISYIRTEGFYSVYDEFGEVTTVPEGYRILKSAFENGDVETGVKLTDGIINMLAFQSVKEVLEIPALRISVETIREVNAELNRIRK